MCLREVATSTSTTPPNLKVVADFVQTVLRTPLPSSVQPLPRDPTDRHLLFERLFCSGHAAGTCDFRNLREKEFARLKDTVYLDQAGSGLYQASHISEANDLLQTSILGNPHSGSTCSRQTQVSHPRAPSDEVIKETFSQPRQRR